MNPKIIAACAAIFAALWAIQWATTQFQTAMQHFADALAQGLF